MPFFRVGDTLAECLHHSLRFFTYYCAKSFNWRNCHHTNKLFLYSLNWASLVAQMVKNLSTVWETQVRSLGWKDSPEKEMATHSSILAWRIAWTKEPGGLQSMELQRVGHNWATNIFTKTGGKSPWQNHLWLLLDTCTGWEPKKLLSQWVNMKWLKLSLKKQKVSGWVSCS